MSCDAMSVLAWDIRHTWCTKQKINGLIGFKIYPKTCRPIQLNTKTGSSKAFSIVRHALTKAAKPLGLRKCVSNTFIVVFHIFTYFFRIFILFVYLQNLFICSLIHLYYIHISLSIYSCVSLFINWSISHVHVMPYHLGVIVFAKGNSNQCVSVSLCFPLPWFSVKLRHPSTSEDLVPFDFRILRLLRPRFSHHRLEGTKHLQCSHHPQPGIGRTRKPLTGRLECCTKDL